MRREDGSILIIDYEQFNQLVNSPGQVISSSESEPGSSSVKSSEEDSFNHIVLQKRKRSSFEDLINGMSQENSTDLREALADVGEVPRESIKVEIMGG